MIKRLKIESFIKKDESICVIGLGYVGLPLAVILARHFDVIGFDIDSDRIAELKRGCDHTGEVESDKLKSVPIEFTDEPSNISKSRFVIVTVPTPVDKHRRPDLTPLIGASSLLAKKIQRGTTVVFESTVYPGCTEEDCIPIIERESGLKWGEDFFVGYSPERINPGDRQHTIDKVKKVVSGDDPETLDLVSSIYASVVTVGVHRAPTIKTAEAAKVIENTQRDLNIALMNELALIFDKLGICTTAVLEAAGTKWNFLPFRPGLVGGHCIGVDPYYLTYKAESLGYHPEVILAGRRINDSMGKIVAERAVKMLIAQDRIIKGAKILILGITFKEDVPDIRNSKVVDIVAELSSYGVNSTVYDPHADATDVLNEYGIKMTEKIDASFDYDAVIFAVKHKVFEEMVSLSKIKDISKYRCPIIIDIKSFYPVEVYNKNGIVHWQL
jgi:UDP-N-acetyl-D-galactosamine dehydrogenase